MKNDEKTKQSASQGDITSVLGKLEKWKNELATDEKAVIDLIVDRSIGIEIDEDLIEAYQFRNALIDELPSVLDRVIDRVGKTSKPDSWMKIGPIWVKSGGSAGFEVAPRVFVERKR